MSAMTDDGTTYGRTNEGDLVTVASGGEPETAPFQPTPPSASWRNTSPSTRTRRATSSPGTRFLADPRTTNDCCRAECRRLLVATRPRSRDHDRLPLRRLGRATLSYSMAEIVRSIIEVLSMLETILRCPRQEAATEPRTLIMDRLALTPHRRGPPRPGARLSEVRARARSGPV